MNEMHRAGHIVEVYTRVSNPDPVNYISHHPVIKQDSLTTKVRGVLHASRKTGNGRSLNDELMVEPRVQDNLIDIIERFRCHTVAIVADVAKMFRQILMHRDDCRYQRVLWRSSPREPLKEYELRTVIYGTSSAPYQATKCIQKMAQRSTTKYPEAAEVAEWDVYVDDVSTGTETTKDAINLRSDLQEMFSGHGFELRKWTSNKPEVIESILNVRRYQDCPMMTTNETSVKIPGLRWHTVEETIYFEAINCEKLNTKRSVLADIAKLFDPLGLVCPFVIRAKILMQELWKDGREWDEPLTGNILNSWLKFKEEIITKQHK